MSLLSTNERKEYFKFLGYGEYNEENIKAFQKAAMRPKDVDGKYGPNTDTALRHFYNVKKYTKNFKPQEFKCECGGRYCTGYPDYMKPVELVHIQKIRDIYGRPITLTCGLRCRPYNNSLKGSIKNSLHLTGYAIDFYQPGVTDTLANRKAAIKKIKTLPNHHYTYGNGINSYGAKISAGYMGNALHTDTNPGAVIEDNKVVTAPVSTQTTGLTIDGQGGPATVKLLQKFLGLDFPDGYISGQYKNLAKYYPALKSVTFGKGGSKTVKRLQKRLGIKEDGIWGEGTSKALQKKLGVKEDGIFGGESMKALQKYLNKQMGLTDVEPPAKTTSTKTTTSSTASSTMSSKMISKAKALSGKSDTRTAAYKKALDTVFPNRGSWGSAAKAGRSCDVFIATLLRILGYDKNCPRGLKGMYTHIPPKEKFTRIVYKNVKPKDVSKTGDIIIYKKKSGSNPPGHTCLRTKTGIYQANNPSKYPHFTKGFSKLNDKRPEVIIWRPIN